MDAVPVEAGSVRLTKRVYSHDELVEQELRTGKVEVTRVQVNRLVDGPQAVLRSGNTMIIPVVKEVLRVERQWVVTEEIHITQTEERETVSEMINVNREEVLVERFDKDGNIVPEPASGSGVIGKSVAGQSK